MVSTCDAKQLRSRSSVNENEKQDECDSSKSHETLYGGEIDNFIQMWQRNIPAQLVFDDRFEHSARTILAVRQEDAFRRLRHLTQPLQDLALIGMCAEIRQRHHARRNGNLLPKDDHRFCTFDQLPR